MFMPHSQNLPVPPKFEFLARKQRRNSYYLSAKPEDVVTRRKATDQDLKIDFDRLLHDKLTGYTKGVVCHFLY